MRLTSRITVEQEITNGYKCDYCGDMLDLDKPSFSWHHDGWGNDSRDSYQYKDVCFKRECLQSFLEDAKDDLASERKTATVELELDYESLQALLSIVTANRSERQVP